jgi:uncharacterized protein
MSNANGPSFNCNNAHTKVEKLICSDDGTISKNGHIKKLDLFLSDIYKQARINDSAGKVRNSQRTWLKKRAKCIGGEESEDDIMCLVDLYQKRITYFFDSLNLTINDEVLNKYYRSAYDSNYRPINEYLEIKPNELTNKIDEKNKIRFINDLIYSNSCAENSGSIYYQMDAFVIVKEISVFRCSGYSFSSVNKSYCLIDGDLKPSSYLSCIGLGESTKNFNQAVLEKLKPLASSYIETSTAINIFEFIFSYPVKLFRSDVLFTDSSLAYIESNIDDILHIFSGGREKIIEFSKGLICTHESIMKNERWEKILASKRNNIWYGNNFDSCNMNKNKSLRNIGIIYTHHDVYTLLWRDLYINGGMSKAYDIASKIIGEDNLKSHNKSMYGINP